MATPGASWICTTARVHELVLCASNVADANLPQESHTRMHKHKQHNMNGAGQMEQQNQAMRTAGPYIMTHAWTIAHIGS